MTGHWARVATVLPSFLLAGVCTGMRNQVPIVLRVPFLTTKASVLRNLLSVRLVTLGATPRVGDVILGSIRILYPLVDAPQVVRTETLLAVPDARFVVDPDVTYWAFRLFLLE